MTFYLFFDIFSFYFYFCPYLEGVEAKNRKMKFFAYQFHSYIGIEENDNIKIGKKENFTQQVLISKNTKNIKEKSETINEEIGKKIEIERGDKDEKEDVEFHSLGSQSETLTALTSLGFQVI